MVNPYSLEMSGNIPSRISPTDSSRVIAKRITSASKVSPWGKDNKEPQRILEDIRSTPLLQSILGWKGRMLYGNGCYLAAATDLDEHGNEILKPVKDSKVQDFLERSQFEQYIRGACANYFQLENIFPELIKTANGKDIYSIARLKTAFGRWGFQNEKTGLIDKFYYHADWDKVALSASDAIEIDVLNEYNPYESLIDSGAKKFIYRYRDYCSDDRIYYNECSWGSIRNSDWLTVAKKIPVFKKFLFDNQAAVKYHVQTTREWWEWKYKGFSEMTAEERISIMKKERAAFESTMTTEEGAGKTIFSTGYVEKASGNFIPGWKIDTLNNKFGSGDYLEDMQEATAQMLISMNVPPSLLGISPGKKFGAGSGSDVRELYNLYMHMQEMERDLMLEPWYLAFKYNRYPNDLRLVFKYPLITTLDKNQETMVTSNGTTN